MQSKDVLLQLNQIAPALTLPLLDDLASVPLQTTVASNGHNAHWLLGHILLSEAQARFMADGTPITNPLFAPLFGGGTQPDPSGTNYPPYDELLTQLKLSHVQTITWIEGLSESELDQTSQHVPPGFEQIFGTWRQVIAMRPLHWMNHRGQLADCRRAAGRKPLMA